jgi:tetratricopeptide (TPR) repeat protein
MSHPDGHQQLCAMSALRFAAARRLVATLQRLGGALLGWLAWMLLPLLLALEPAAALDHVAAVPVMAPLTRPSISSAGSSSPSLRVFASVPSGAAALFPASAIAAFMAAPLQPSRPSAASANSPPDPLPGRSGIGGSVRSPSSVLAGVIGAQSPYQYLTAPPPDSPSSLPALFQQALEASRAGRFDLALPLWNRVLEQAPKDAAAWSNRGNVQLALGDPLAAIADQDHSLLLEPDNADPHLNRGTAEEALGRWDAAAADYAWILERNPLDASALYNLGNVQGSRGDWQAARDSFVAAADARPGFAMARSSGALAAFQLGDLATAEREFRSLIRRYPLFADARAGLTALLWQRGASGEAESHWAAASGLDPRYRQGDWLLKVRRWPPEPVVALERFLHFNR